MKTQSLGQAKYLLQRALTSRGLGVTVEGREFKVVAPNGSYSLGFMPGNRRVLISHSVQVDQGRRGLGWGRRYLQQREDVAKEAGCNLLIATVRNDNAPEMHLLETAGWLRLIKRTTGVSLWGKLL